MRTHRDRTTPVPPTRPPQPTHAFTPEYLELLAHRDEPVTVRAVTESDGLLIKEIDGRWR